MTKDEWKRQLYERICKEIYAELDWNLFSEQVDEYVYTFGGGLILDGGIPPHRKFEIWTRSYLEKQIIEDYHKAAKREFGNTDGEE